FVADHEPDVTLHTGLEELVGVMRENSTVPTSARYPWAAGNSSGVSTCSMLVLQSSAKLGRTWSASDQPFRDGPTRSALGAADALVGSADTSAASNEC
ncbi:hypothetical protein, partial [Candidatus Microthrix parvicella]|uniref:hypothetical protein n=1 Tax=Candidatus Neomicrothrix parvicella TaxID=41950 RepID=UPI001F1D4020